MATSYKKETCQTEGKDTRGGSGERWRLGCLWISRYSLPMLVARHELGPPCPGYFM